MIRHVTFGYLIHDELLFHNALNRPTHRPTDRPRESLTTIGPYASNESDAA